VNKALPVNMGSRSRAQMRCSFRALGSPGFAWLMSSGIFHQGAKENSGQSQHCVSYTLS
jgi:hypothetical protein